MSPKFIFLWLTATALAVMKVAQLASFIPDRGPILAHNLGADSPRGQVDFFSSTPANSLVITSTGSEISSLKSYTQPGSTPSSFISPTLTSFTAGSSSQTEDASNDFGDFTQKTPISSSTSAPSVTKPEDASEHQNDSTNTNQDSSSNQPGSNPTPTRLNSPAQQAGSSSSNSLNALLYSIFIVYVSIAKLIYHNFSLVKRYLTEPGMLMLFGIIWELVTRQVGPNSSIFPRFDPRIFFYLFLPSTILDSASLLSNKWLFLNLLQILTLSIVGTLIYACALGYTIYSLSHYDSFRSQIQATYITSSTSYIPAQSNMISENNSLFNTFDQSQFRSDSIANVISSGLDSSPMQASLTEVQNLTIVDCLLFGTMLSSVDSTTLLNVFRNLQVNDRLYYLTLGETLLNNAVVLVLFDLLLDFFNAHLTVVKIYSAIIQFFITLSGAVLIGLVIAGVALVAVRLTKHLQQPSSALASYQGQGQAMVETLLILKVAYLAYTLARYAGTSSILSLATFGIVQDQYIKYNLNLRSQLTLRQVIIATKTLGYSLIYPLLGMLLVEVANTTQFYQTHQSKGETSSMWSGAILSVDDPRIVEATASFAPTKLTEITSRANLLWNFKFIAVVTVSVLLYRFLIVVFLSLFCNLCSSRQLKIKLTEQLLLAYGGLKGPLAFALVSRLVEHEEYRYKSVPNKHLFMSTILFITFLSTLLKGALVRPLVSRFQSKISSKLGYSLNNGSPSVISKLNIKLVEYVEHGLNSIIGHTKSPYERFTEFNETRIKPWVTRQGSNTNWLSVFYDNLILDESLNGNCFFRSALQLESNQANPSTLQIRRHSEHSLSDRTISLRRIRSSSLSDHNSHPGRRKSVKSINRVGPNTSDLGRFQNQISQGFDEQLKMGGRSLALKEMVMLNLKEESSRVRRDKMSARFDTSSRADLSRRKVVKMLSSTSLEDSHSPPQIKFSPNKRRQMKIIEMRLNDEDKETSLQPGVSRRHSRQPRKRVVLK